MKLSRPPARAVSFAAHLHPLAPLQEQRLADKLQTNGLNLSQLLREITVSRKV